MKADIVNIPVSEVFEKREGCPLCTMRDALEARVVDYITGAALMEPDVRLETNDRGFCERHFGMLLQKKNRLGVALLLESHLAEVDKKVFGGRFGRKKAADSCFVCDKVDRAARPMLTTVCRLYETEPESRELFASQECRSLPHSGELVELSAGMNKRYGPDFAEAAAGLCRSYLTALRRDVTHFTKMFDYRNHAADWGNSKDAIERAVWWLTGRKP